MRSAISVLLLAAGANALVSRGQPCCFHLNAPGNGGPVGQVGQLGDGQNRLGQSGLPEGTYCLGPNGGVTDGKGRGCILTPPTTQWQCDVGATPTPGFSVNCQGGFSYNGGTTFYACPTGDNGGWNIYGKPLPNEPRCQQITLNADQCKAQCQPQPPPPAQCPKNLNGDYQFPHLIVKVNSRKPDMAYGTSYDAKMHGAISTIYNFDIPQSYAGKTCNLIFLLPPKNKLVTSSYTYGGSGGIDFYRLQGPATQGTTYNNRPAVAQDYGTSDVHPNSKVSVAQFPCPAGQRIGFWGKSHGAQGSYLAYFQDFNPPAIGAYITTC